MIEGLNSLAPAPGLAAAAACLPAARDVPETMVIGEVEAIWSAIDRANQRKCYRQLLENEELLRDIGVTREQVQRALAECS